MTSLRARLIIGLLRVSGQKRFYADVATMHRKLPAHQRASKARPPRWLRRNYRIEQTEVHGFPCYTLRPPGPLRQDLHLLHLHGGAYVEQIERHHWNFAGHVIDRLGCAVTLPIYPLAPRFDHTKTVPMVEAVYERVLDGCPPEHRIISGDSAGAGLALAVAQRLRADRRPQPARLVLFSPWLDVTMEDPVSALIDERDPMLGVPGLREAGRMYADQADPHDPEISPINADFTGLGPFSVFIGTRDLLLPQARWLKREVEEAGKALDYVEYPGMFHNWMMQPIPEGREALDQLERILRRPPPRR
ncbi:alpha/beta hydrolase fold domain-containing protein [Amycolatopsis anabasis]|uniref:alpha/beta hydrolase fold domain-containing protein n=1 Tax=Amycolatopsis anabasis TaxID=1840409 RepID=UPI00131C214C|nr:alpha/beta hydrolase [Amycolatopsis anabasis]